MISCSWEFALSNSAVLHFLSIVVSTEINRKHYIQSNLHMRERGNVLLVFFSSDTDLVCSVFLRIRILIWGENKSHFRWCWMCNETLFAFPNNEIYTGPCCSVSTGLRLTEWWRDESWAASAIASLWAVFTRAVFLDGVVRGIWTLSFLTKSPIG